MFHYFRAYVLVLLAILMSTSSAVPAGPKKATGKGVKPRDPLMADIVTADGSMNLEILTQTYGHCGRGINSANIQLHFSKAAESCGMTFRKKREMQSYKMACITTCMLKAYNFINASNQFEANVEKLVKQTEKLQLADNMVRARQLCEEMARCAREVPPYNPENCYSSFPFYMCYTFALQRVCLGPVVPDPVVKPASPTIRPLSSNNTGRTTSGIQHKLP